jgi:formylmethanofuran dehydrogenase subunit D
MTEKELQALASRLIINSEVYPRAAADLLLAAALVGALAKNEGVQVEMTVKLGIPTVVVTAVARTASPPITPSNTTSH